MTVLTGNAKSRPSLAGTFIKKLMSFHVGLEAVNSMDQHLYHRLKRIPPKSSQNPGFQLAEMKEVVSRYTADKRQVTTACSRQVPSVEQESQVSKMSTRSLRSQKVFEEMEQVAADSGE
jgi:hypothetical protein